MGTASSRWYTNGHEVYKLFTYKKKSMRIMQFVEAEKDLTYTNLTIKYFGVTVYSWHYSVHGMKTIKESEPSWLNFIYIKRR